MLSAEGSIQRLIDNVPAAIFIFQRDKNRLVNPAAEAVTGYTRRELLGMDFWHILHPDFRELVRERGLARQKGSSVPPRYEVKIVRKDGEERWLDYSGGLIRFRGKPAVIGAAIDITEKKRAELKAEQHLKRLTAINVLTTATTQSLDLAATLEEAARSILELFRFDGTRIYLFDDAMESLHLRAAFDTFPGLLPAAKAIRSGAGCIGKAAKTGDPLVFEDLQIDPRYDRLSRSGRARKEGVRFFAAIPIRSKLRAWGALVCVGKESRRLGIEDIDLLITLCNGVAIAVENATLYQQTAEKAKELSALYSVAAIAAGVLDVHALLHQSMRKVLEIFGFTAARIYIVDDETREIRLAAQEGFPPDFVAPASYRPGEGLVGEVIESGRTLTFEDMRNDPAYQRMAKARLMLQAGFRASFFIPLRVRGETLGVMNLVKSEPHAFSPNELQLINAIAYHLGIAVENASIFARLRRKTADLEKANRTKDEFLSVMSHELRTPLNVVMGYTELIRKGMFGQVNTEMENAILKIVKQTHKLLSMIDSILLATKIEAGAVAAERREVDVLDLMNDLKSSYDLLPRPGVRLEWKVQAGMPPLRADGDKLRSILQNLIDNAIKFTERGCVTVSAAHFPEADRTEFSVADTGIGIDPAKAEAIFEKFYQVDSSETRTYGGMGLGLYIVKRLAELLGGRVAVRSELGKGATFTVAIPSSPGG
ncbi:MAG TPA: GAF domain-containing protein [candidate division Zixibacteria bacterium]|nr:GAF domain-containing protein [candidate division Zixibacteria bacterium]